MKLIIDIPEEIYKASQIVDVKYEDVIQIPLEVIANGKPLDGVLQEIRQEIEKPLRDERCYDTADAKAQYIALNWVCEIIDKHIKEIADETDN